MPLRGIVTRMIRIFKTRNFQRWMRKSELVDAVADGALLEIIDER